MLEAALAIWFCVYMPCQEQSVINTSSSPRNVSPSQTNPKKKEMQQEKQTPYSMPARLPYAVMLPSCKKKKKELRLPLLRQQTVSMPV
jgi:hypothetical protein